MNAADKATRSKEARDKITRARIAMIVHQPFFGTLALRLRVIEDDTLNPPTLNVDGKTVRYHPDWVINTEFEIVKSGFAHEVGHCIFDHIGRRNGREPKRWNQAGDYVINPILKDSGFTIGDNWLYNPIYAGLSADTVYNALPPDPPGDAFDSIPDKVDSDTDPEITRDDWQIAAVQAATAAAGVGKLPGSLKRFIQEMVTPKADWRSVMSRFVTEQAKDDYSYAHLNRKWASLGIYLPGLYSERMGEVDVGVDTSGSISDAVLAAFVGHTNEVKNQMRPTLMRMIYCDAAVNHVDEFEEHDEITPTPCGGGGTDFRPVFDLIETEQWEPKCAMYLTDGYGPFPKNPPPYPVLWLMTTDVMPPWGEVVRIEV